MFKLQGVPKNMTNWSVMFRLQGVPKNMTVPTQIDRRLLTFSRPTYLHLFNSWNKNHKILLVLAFPKCDLPFCCQYYWRYWEFCSDFNQGRIQEFVQGGDLYFFIFPGRGAQHPLGSENPLKSIDFTGPGGA